MGVEPGMGLSKGVKTWPMVWNYSIKMLYLEDVFTYMYCVHVHVQKGWIFFSLKMRSFGGGNHNDKNNIDI